jgi:hypothetical protein
VPCRSPLELQQSVISLLTTSTGPHCGGVSRTRAWIRPTTS